VKRKNLSDSRRRSFAKVDLATDCIHLIERIRMDVKHEHLNALLISEGDGMGDGPEAPGDPE
jgi:hypothetical protein